MSLHILGIGTAVPQHYIEQHDAAVAARIFCEPSRAQQQVLKKLYERSGVRTRHSVVLQGSAGGPTPQQDFYVPSTEADGNGPTTAERMAIYEESAGLLSLSASATALMDGEVAASHVTHLVTISCTGFHSPGVDVALVRGLGLNPGVARTHLGFMGCHAALNGFRVAKAFTDSRPEACVLICTVELCSLHYQYGWHSDHIVSNALFADGAASVVARGTVGPKRYWELIDSASTVVPDTEDAMSWHIRDHGFEMTLSSQVPELIQLTLRPWIEAWLASHNLSLADIGSWAIHPGGPRILTASRDACGLGELDLQASSDVLAEFGNMSSPTIIFILERLRRTDAAGPCVALAFGPGLTIEAALFV